MTRFASKHEKEIDVVVIIKAAPEIGVKHGETVCVAGIDFHGNWHRLYPVAFRDLRTEQRFQRWDVIRVRWRHPSGDKRVESKRIDPISLTKVGRVRQAERAGLVARALVPSLEAELSEGRTLAIIRPENVKFQTPRLSAVELAKSLRRRAALLSQGDMLARSMIAPDPPPVSFKYTFDHAGRRRKHSCIDWETEHTFYKWRREYGEDKALKLMRQKWGEEMPAKGLVFAMGTHRVPKFKNWLLSGVLQVPEVGQKFLL